MSSVTSHTVAMEASASDISSPSSGSYSTDDIGVWEWNPSLAIQRRVETEKEFQKRLANAEDGRGITALVDDEEEATEMHLYHVPPQDGPGMKRKDYRCSPLVPHDDDKLIPNAQVEDVAAALPAAIERERLVEVEVLPLLGKRIWRYKGLDYEKSHPFESGLVTTEDSWANGNKTGVGPWPAGCEYDSSVFALCWAFFCFVYCKNKRASIKVILCEVICSLVPPACSYLAGTGLLDELTASTSKGDDDKTRFINVSLYTVGILLLRIFANWLTVYYDNSIPTGGTRTALHDVLFHRMQHLQSPLRDKLTPGASSEIIYDNVYNAVDIYSQFLTFPSLVIGILANIAFSVASLPFQFIPIVAVPSFIVIFLVVLVPILINWWFQPEYCILTRLEHQWKMRMCSLAGSAIPRQGRSYRSSGGNETENKLADIFHETAFLERMRKWQAWKLSLVMGFLIGSLAQFGIAVVTVCAGYAVIEGMITVGNFTTLTSCITGIATLGNSIGSFLTGLFEDHTMLKQITCIMNDEDIDFDGGVDIFEKGGDVVEGMGRHVARKAKKAGKKVIKVGTQAAQTTNFSAGKEI